MRRLRRREVIAGLGGAAVAWPLVTDAQQTKLPTIGVLGTQTAATWAHWVAALEERLAQLGWVLRRTVEIAYRWGESREERFARDGIAFMARECHGRDELRGPRRCPSPMSKATSGTTVLECGTPRTGRARP